MSDIKLSIITPVYNGATFIESCVKNVLAQDALYVEHIIVDDGSTDHTIRLLQPYQEKHPSIRLFQEDHIGQAAAMNKGIDLARGSILGFLNVDDFYEPNVFNRILTLFAGLPEPTLLVGNCKIIDHTGQLKYINKPNRLSLAAWLLGRGMHCSLPENPTAYFYHKSLHNKIGPYNPEEDYVMDLDFLFRAVQAAHCRYIDEVWGNFYIVKGCKTYNVKKNDQMFTIVSRVKNQYLHKLPLPQRVFIFLWTQWRYYISRVRHYWLNPNEIASFFRRSFDQT